MSSKERNEEQAMLGKETKFQRHGCQYHWSVYVTAVIGHENIAGVRINFFQALYDDAHTAKTQQHTAPESRDLVRPAPGVVKERSHKGHHGHRHRDQDDQRVRDQIRSYLAERHG